MSDGSTRLIITKSYLAADVSLSACTERAPISCEPSVAGSALRIVTLKRIEFTELESRWPEEIYGMLDGFEGRRGAPLWRGDRRAMGSVWSCLMGMTSKGLCPAPGLNSTSTRNLSALSTGTLCVTE